MGSYNFGNDERKLIERLQKGDEQAFASIYEKFKRKVFNFSHLYLKSKQEAEEVVQDTFVRLWQNRQNIDPGNSLNGYIFKIVKNLSLNRLRKKVDDPKNFETIRPDHLTSAHTENKVIFNEMSEIIEKAIERMPERRKQIFLLSRFKGFTNKEIAEKMEISIRTVEGQLNKALTYIREYMNDIHILLIILFLF